MSYVVYRKENRANRQNPVARIKLYCVKKNRSQKSEIRSSFVIARSKATKQSQHEIATLR